MEPVVLFRGSIREEEELFCAKKYFNVVESRSLCKNNIVVPRYSALPYYYELERDLKYNGCKMINTFDQHLWIANFDYYEVLFDYTFESYSQRVFPFIGDDGSKWVVKGATNSKKHRWDTQMFAKNKKEAIAIGVELQRDDLISQQEIIYRKYVPLKTFERGENGLPYSDEWRFFFLGKKMLSYGYYWSIAEKAEEYNKNVHRDCIDFAQYIANIASEYVNFFVLDVAQKETGGWILVEVNDAQMSGLSMNDPDVLYFNLKKELQSAEKILT